MEKVDSSDIDFDKLKKLDVVSYENKVYLDEENKKIYKKFKSLNSDELIKKEENLRLLDEKRDRISMVIPSTMIMDNNTFIGTIEEYIKGIDLKNIKDISICDKLSICLDMSKVLEKLHDESIVVSDINPSNIRVKEDNTTCFLDSLSSGVNGRNPMNTSRLLFNYFKNTKMTPKKITKEHDRITMMMLIIETLVNKKFNYITYYEYMENAEKIKVLKELLGYFEAIRTNQKNIDMPYLQEIISEEHIKKYKKELQN